MCVPLGDEGAEDGGLLLGDGKGLLSAEEGWLSPPLGLTHPPSLPSLWHHLFKCQP